VNNTAHIQPRIPVENTTYVDINGMNADIIRVIHKMLPKAAHQVKGVAHQFVGNTVFDTTKNIWAYLKRNINYKEDSNRLQVIQLPSKLLSTKQGDCKSYSLFTAAILYCLDIPFKMRYTNYSGGTTPRHVYVVALDEKNEPIIIDAVYHTHNAEKPYKYKTDFYMIKPGINGTNVLSSPIGALDPMTLSLIMNAAGSKSQSGGSQSTGGGAPSTGGGATQGGIFDFFKGFSPASVVSNVFGKGVSKNEQTWTARSRMWNEFATAANMILDQPQNVGKAQKFTLSAGARQWPSVHHGWWYKFDLGQYDNGGAEAALQDWLTTSAKYGITAKAPAGAAGALSSGIGKYLLIGGGIIAVAGIAYFIFKRKKK
jgi:hypothetical protein